MNNNMIRIAKYFMAAAMAAGSLISFALAQPAEPLGQEVRFSGILGTSRYSNTCLQVDTIVYNEETLKKLLAFKQCSEAIGDRKIDLQKETLIGWQTASDCHMRVENRLYRNDEKKLFTFVIKNFYGGCRAGGWRQGLFTIEKIPADYKFKFIEYRIDDLYEKPPLPSSKYEETWTADGQKLPPEPPAVDGMKSEKTTLAEFLSPVTSAAADGSKTTSLETREIDLKGCVGVRNMSFETVIRDDETFQKAIGSGAGGDVCRKTLEKIDFGKQTLLGIFITSDYCDRPHGLEYKTLRDDTKKLYTLQVSYTDPQGSLCRRIGYYDLWVLVPKMPDGYKAAFNLQMIPPKTN